MSLTIEGDKLTITRQEYNKVLDILTQNNNYELYGFVPPCILYTNRMYNCTCGSRIQNIKTHLNTDKHKRHLAYLRDIKDRCIEPEENKEEEKKEANNEDEEEYNKLYKEKQNRRDERRRREEENNEDEEEQAIGPNQ